MRENGNSRLAPFELRLTIGEQVVVRLDDALVEGACIGRRLERQSVALLARAPVVECGHHLEILQVPVDGTAENDRLVGDALAKDYVLVPAGVWRQFRALPDRNVRQATAGHR